MCVCVCVCVSTVGSVQQSALEVGLAELECHRLPKFTSPGLLVEWTVGLERATAEGVRTLPVGCGWCCPGSGGPAGGRPGATAGTLPRGVGAGLPGLRES